MKALPLQVGGTADSLVQWVPYPTSPASGTKFSALTKAFCNSDKFVFGFLSKSAGAADSLSSAFESCLSKSAGAADSLSSAFESCLSKSAGAADSLSSAFESYLSKSAGAADSLSCFC